MGILQLVAKADSRRKIAFKEESGHWAALCLQQ